jgi:hypothetical protein
MRIRLVLQLSSSGEIHTLPFMLKYKNTLRSCYGPQRTQIEENGLVPYLSYIMTSTFRTHLLTVFRIVLTTTEASPHHV